MKKGWIFTFIAVATGFCFAVASCFVALSLPRAVAQSANMRIVIDAGHGGVDGGVVGVYSKRKESEINLGISFLLKDRLTDLGFSVTLTRATAAGLYDTTAPGFKRRDMQKRKEICEAASPLLVISVHQNFFPSSSSRGGQVFYAAADQVAGAFAASIQGELNKLYAEQGVKPRTQKTGDYYMLRLSVPSIIVECGFLSNEKDDQLLNTPSFCVRLSESIVTGVLSEVKNLSAA